MKRFLILLLITILVLSAAGCGSSGETSAPVAEPTVQETGGETYETAAPEGDSGQETISGADDSGQEQPAGAFETEEIRLIDDLYDEDELAFIQSIQGHITHIDNGGTFPVLIADNKVYSEDYGTLTERLSLPAAPDSIIYFDNISIGENLFAFSNGKLSLYPFDEYSICFEDIDFNEATDFVADIGMSSYFTIVRQEGDGYVIDYYESSSGDSHSDFTQASQNPLETIETYNVEEISAKQIIPLRSNSNGYSVYILTDNNDVYALDAVSSYGTLTVSPSSPLLSNVERVIAPNDVSTYLTVPIHSKVGDSSNLYAAACGADLLDTADNFEITFPLPDGHTPEEVSDVFRAADKLVFVFTDGGTYYTEDIEEEDRSSYDMIRLDDVSQLNADGSILDMAGVTVFDDNLYLLMDDGKLYYRPLE